MEQVVMMRLINDCSIRVFCPFTESRSVDLLVVFYLSVLCLSFL